MIKLNLDRVMQERQISLTELADRIGITLANLSILKTNKARAIRFTTLDALCRALNASRANCWSSFPAKFRVRKGIEFGIHLHAIGVKMNGAAGENRTHDLSLTKGLRYHYATTATVVIRSVCARTLNQGCAAIT